MTAVTTIRDHLLGLSGAFAEGNREAVPSRNICDGTGQHSEAFTRLCFGWVNCQTAAGVINQRYYSDWQRAGGALTVIAPAVRETALTELSSVWASVVETYLGEVGGD
ncbi:hypothetical protein [Mycolicibacter minnesotensis]